MATVPAGFSISAHTKELIEDEVKRIIDEGYDEAHRILTERTKKTGSGWPRACLNMRR